MNSMKFDARKIIRDLLDASLDGLLAQQRGMGLPVDKTYSHKRGTHRRTDDTAGS